MAGVALLAATVSTGTEALAASTTSSATSQSVTVRDHGHGGDHARRGDHGGDHDRGGDHGWDHDRGGDHGRDRCDYYYC